MKELLNKNIFFLLPYSLFLLSGGIVVAMYTKAEIHLYINQFHNPFFDSFFFTITFLGDGFFVAILLVAFLFYNYRTVLIVGASYLVSSAVVQILKNFVFTDSIRPAKYFEGIYDLYIIPGTDTYIYNSFPSGHTTTAFAICFSMAMISSNKIIKSIMFLIALMVGFSRTYLSQHFFIDIYVGSVIGAFTAFFVFYFAQKSQKINQIKWIDNSLIKRFKN